MAVVDTIITFVILATFLLIIISRATGQTIPELFRETMDLIQEKKEEATEETMEVVKYE